MNLSKPFTVLMIEDEEDLVELVSFNLIQKGYSVLKAKDGEEGYTLALQGQANLILLDLMLPKIDGLTLCKLFKENPQTSSLPIIMITAKGEEEDIIQGLEAGADDYITKPFTPRILLARIKAIQRRIQKKGEGGSGGNGDGDGQDILRGHGLSIDTSRCKVLVGADGGNGGNEVEMTYSEFQILLLLVKNSGRVYTRSQIVNIVHGTNHAIADRSVDVQIVAIRKKLGEVGQYVETVRGVGYRFKEILPPT